MNLFDDARIRRSVGIFWIQGSINSADYTRAQEQEHPSQADNYKYPHRFMAVNVGCQGKLALIHPPQRALIKRRPGV
jgi:hypothetical protein